MENTTDYSSHVCASRITENPACCIWDEIGFTVSSVSERNSGLIIEDTRSSAPSSLVNRAKTLGAFQPLFPTHESSAINIKLYCLPKTMPTSPNRRRVSPRPGPSQSQEVPSQLNWQNLAEVLDIISLIVAKQEKLMSVAQDPNAPMTWHWSDGLQLELSRMIKDLSEKTLDPSWYDSMLYVHSSVAHRRGDLQRMLSLDPASPDALLMEVNGRKIYLLDFKQRENAFRYIARKSKEIASASSEIARLRREYLSNDATGVCYTVQQSCYDILLPKKI
jgi:hypothetical protein